MTLSTDDFAAFFHAVHGCTPFPWQTRLLAQVVAQGTWPGVLDLPTGTGKTAAIDIALFHLALEAARGADRRAPVRIAFVVDRRLVIDDAFRRAQKLAAALAGPQDPVVARVAAQLKYLAGDGPPLVARRLRGGIPREDDWARTPSQPTVLCSTVDQIGSRLLFRGYGVSSAMQPVHAGLIGSDCLIQLDEAHLAEPFRQTLGWVHRYRGPDWREAETAAPWGVALLTATLGKESPGDFALGEADRQHPVLARRLNAAKPARLLEAKAVGEDGRARVIAAKVLETLGHCSEAGDGVPCPAIGVVVNRIARARAVLRHVQAEIGAEEKKTGVAKADCLLLIGPARAVDREDIARRLDPVRTGADRQLEKPLILVATQCIEAGVDIDLDALVTEAAPLDCLRQRFGRLNRAGRDIVPRATIVAIKSDLAARADDPVYGKTIRPAWDSLMAAADVGEGGDPVVAFGLNDFRVPMAADTLAPKPDAPILLPAHLDLLSQTAPVPAADPDVSLYLHGTVRQPDSITIVWRADIRNDDPADIHRLLTLVPPRSSEAIELPLWAVRHWLAQGDKRSGEGAEQEEQKDKEKALAHLADIATAALADEVPMRHDDGQRQSKGKVFRWCGNNDQSGWIEPASLRPGDMIVVPADYGGVDNFGWNPGHGAAAKDVGRKAAEPFAGRRFAVRVAPGLTGQSMPDESLADALAGATSHGWADLRAALLDAPGLPGGIQDDLGALDDANRKGSVTAFPDLYGTDNGRPRGVVFVAPFGIRGRQKEEDGRPNTTGDDTGSSIAGFPLSLQDHSKDVERQAGNFARAAGLPAGRVVDLELAGFLHDAGKADPRFQAWLYHGDPLGPDPEDAKTVLAKSGRALPPTARAAAGLPKNWRHEALSVRMAPSAGRFGEARDPELVLWLVGSHHGHGRPFFPHRDPADDKARSLPAVSGLVPAALPPGPGPQSLAFDWQGLDWPSLFARLKARYGVWELARMEAILRLADHRASEARAREQVA